MGLITLAERGEGDTMMQGFFAAAPYPGRGRGSVFRGASEGRWSGRGAR